MQTRLPTWLRGRFEVRRDGRAEAVVRREFLPTFEARALIRAAGDPSPEAAPAGRLAGRGPIRVIPAGALGEAVVRPGRRGGLPGRFLERRYLLGNRAVQELVVTERLRWAGVPVAEPLAAVREERRIGYLTAVITRRVPGAPLSRLLREAGDDAERTRLLARAARAVRRLHDAGGWHADLNAGNLVLDPETDGPAVLVDFDRGRAFPGAIPRPLARRALARLRRSLAKLELEAALEAWPAFLESYHAAEGADAEGSDAERVESTGGA